MSLLFAQETDLKAIQDYLLLQEYEQALFQSRESHPPLSLEIEQKKILEACSLFIQQYPSHSLAHEVRLILAQYTPNLLQKEQLLKSLLQNKNVSLSLKERAFLLDQEFFPNQYFSSSILFEKQTQFLQTSQAWRWSFSLYYQNLYLRQEYKILLGPEFREKLANSFFEEEGSWALQILSSYGLGQQQEGEKEQIAFLKKFPKSSYLPLFESKRQKHQLCSQIAPMLADVDVWENPFSLKQYQGQEILLLFWAPWEKQSKEALYWLASLRVRYPSLICVGVFFSEKKSEGMDILLTNTSFRWPQLFAGSFLQSPIAQRFRVKQLPTFYWIESSGQIRFCFQETRFLEYHLEQQFFPKK